uniref:Preprotein translocase subunit SecG n=1 Tax=Pseudellipsoidion edaphicum TaxID=1431838 RepID=A0A410D2Y8_9STRA|nr:preprotein translocase subunit SecG [Pseudellipsoidion edaphicum]QAA12063.1 preprotein translocase subunit SecG [Pseudellipsoidion edaphicum]
MNIVFNILFFSPALLIFFLIINRNPARLSGFEKSRNKSIDKIILLILFIFILVLFQFKCR